MSGAGFEFDLFDPARAGVYAAPTGHLMQLGVAARGAGLHTIEADLAGCRDKATLLLRLNSALDAPAGAGRNWDALSDLLRDLGWLGDAAGHVLLLGDADDLRASAPEAYATLLDILQEAVDAWAESDTPFWAFVGVSDDGADASEA